MLSTRGGPITGTQIIKKVNKQFLRAGCGTRPSREGRAEGGVRSGPLLIVYRGCVWRRPGPQSLYEAHTAAIGFMVSHGEPSDRRFTKDICYRAASKNLLTPVVQPRVACLGDSLTRGDGRHETGKSHGPSARVIAGRGNYPLALVRMARSWTVANFGRGGSTSRRVRVVIAHPVRTPRRVSTMRLFAGKQISTWSC